MHLDPLRSDVQFSSVSMGFSGGGARIPARSVCSVTLSRDIVPFGSWTWTLRPPRPDVRHRHLPCHAMPCTCGMACTRESRIPRLADFRAFLAAPNRNASHVLQVGVANSRNWRALANDESR